MNVAGVMGARPSRTFMLTRGWETIRGTTTTGVVEDDSRWLELPGYADATFWVECSNVTAPPGGTGGLVLLQIETSPTGDDSTFRTVAGPIVLQATSTPFVLKTASLGAVPLCRFNRFRLLATTGGTWDATIRIRVAANRTAYWAPAQLGPRVVWYRPDLGLGFGGTTISTWSDWSGIGDINRNLTAGSAPPTVNASDVNYGNQATVSFSGNVNCYFISGTYSSVAVQPITWVLIANRTSTSGTHYLMDGDSTGFGHAIWDDNTDAVTCHAGTALTTATSYPLTSPSMVAFEVNGNTSNIYIGSLTTPVKSGPSGGNNFNSMTLGAHSIFFGGGSPWQGTIAEVIGIGAVLTSTQKGLLRTYINSRYACPAFTPIT